MMPAIRQPLVPIVLLYGAGVMLSHFVEAPLIAAYWIAVALTLVGLLSPASRSWVIPAALLLFGWWNMTSRTVVVSPHDLRLLVPDGAQLVTVRGRIVDTPSQRIFTLNGVEKSHMIAELELSAARVGLADWQQAHGKVMTRTPGVLPTDFSRGQRVEVSGLAIQPPAPIAPELFDYARHLARRGIHRELKVESAAHWQPLGIVAPPLLPERFRSWAQRTLARGLPVEDEPLRLQWAMLLGWQTALTSEVSEPFMRSGTMHIFAISGLHIALISWIFLALLRALLLPRWAGGAAVIGIIWFYTAATGWQASAVRSTIMMTVIIAASLKRPTSLVNSLAAAAAVILVWEPEQLFQAGFQLSFSVVLSLALLSPPIERLRARLFALDPMLPLNLRPGWQRFLILCGLKVWNGFAASLAAFIGAAPLMAWYFHLFTPGSLLANLVVVPVSSLALMSGLGAMVTGDVAPFLTELFNHSGWGFMRLMTWLSERAADLPGAWRHVRAPGVELLLLYYGPLLALCGGWLNHRAARWTAGIAATVLAMIWANHWREWRRWDRLTVLPVGGAHMVHYQPAHGAGDWLINCGNASSAGFTLKPYLQAHGVNRIPHLVLTHGDARYFGGATEVRNAFKISEVLVSPLKFRSPAYHEILSELEATSRVRRVATNGHGIPPWKVIHPQTVESFALAEDKSMVLRGECAGLRVLHVPQLGRAGQNTVFARHPGLKADIIIAGLPTQDEPLAGEWLEVLQPRLIVIADSGSSAAPRAGRALLARLRSTGAAVVSTAESGAATIWIRDDCWRVTTTRGVIASGPAPERVGRDAPGE